MTEAVMREPTFLILTALAERPLHGYGIIADVGRISEGRVRLRAGTLYAALDRLRTEGLVEVDREEIVDTRLRRCYRLTAACVTRLAEETVRLHDNAAAATVRLSRRGIALGGGPA